MVFMWCSPKLNAVSLSMKLTTQGGGVHHITTVTNKALLIASHIKPWCECNNA
ncbi:hypothetical protein J2Y64_002140 [Aeromonas salmonicida]|nr:hypothetical protein [Aeromonas salmonicida]